MSSTPPGSPKCNHAINYGPDNTRYLDCLRDVAASQLEDWAYNWGLSKSLLIRETSNDLRNGLWDRQIHDTALHQHVAQIATCIMDHPTLPEGKELPHNHPLRTKCYHLPGDILTNIIGQDREAIAKCIAKTAKEEEDRKEKLDSILDLVGRDGGFTG
jgi:hypothetical protein